MGILVVLAMLVQITIPVATQFAYANREQEPMVQEESVLEEESLEDTKEELKEEIKERVKSEESKEKVTKNEEKQGKVSKKKIKEETNENVKLTSSGGKNLGDILTSVKLTVRNDDDVIEVKEGNNSIKVEDGTIVELEYDWEISDDIDLESGDWAEVKIPDIFLPRKDIDTGDLLFGGEKVGDYTLSKDSNNLKLVFNDKLKGLYDRKGKIIFSLKFDLEEFIEDSTQTAKFKYPIDKEFTIILKPEGETSLISKTGKPNGKINATNITWYIDVNTSLEEIENLIVTDNIPGGLKLDRSSIEVYNLIVGYGGKLTLGNRIENINTDVSENGFELGLGKTNSAYRIKYVTRIEDYSKIPFRNEATILDGQEKIDSANFTIDNIEKGNLIEKEGKANKNINSDKITWTIDVNKSELELENVIIEDLLEDNRLTIDNNSIRIYELNNAENQWKQGIDATDEFKKGKELSFPIKLGDINKKAYRIVFDTDIAYGKEYIQNSEFTNKAILKENTETKDDAEAKVIVKRDSILEKSGVSKINYDTKEINWTINLNKANHLIKNAVIGDEIGEGLELREGSIKIYDNKGEEVHIDTEGGFPKLTIDGKNKFNVELGDIETAYKIEYITDITDYNKVKFENKASLKGDGLSGDGIIGEEITKEYSANTKIENKYFKSRFDDSYGIDYENKTMSWTIIISPIKEKVTELIITDTFPNNGMVFLPETLEIMKVGQSEPLKENIDYTIEPIENGYENGFILKFNEGYVLEGADYYIKYDTSFDLDYENIIINETNKYINEVRFSGRTVDKNGEVHEIKAGNKVSYKIKDIAYNGGKKDGALDRNNRKINWKLYTNYMAQDLKGKEFIVRDTFSNGQKLDENSIVVKEYQVESNGNIRIGKTLLKENYKFEPIESGFVLTFEEGIDKPYVIEYTTDIVGISKDKYENEAKVSSEGRQEETYKDILIYPDHNKFIVKEGEGIEKNEVFTDDEINWKITINESLSDIENAKFEDTISSGHVFVDGSLRVYKGAVSEDNLVDSEDYTFTKTLEKSGKFEETKLEVNLGDINSVYIVIYDTVVITDSGSVKNTASFSGKELDNVQDVVREYEVSQTSSGTGSGVNRGSIKIRKVDAEDNKPLVAGFELYYLLNGEEQKVKINGDTVHFTDENGVLEFNNLSLRKYYLREVEVPEGYSLDKTIHEMELNKENKNIEKSIENKKIPLVDITGRKRWIGGLEEKPTIKLQLYRNGEKIGEPVDLENGTLEYTWKDLYERSENGEEYEYTIRELDIPENYESKVDGFTVTNVNVEKIDIPVEKKWIGPEAEGVTIKLLADGKEVETLTLTAKDNWQGKFEGLLKYNQETGEEINYTIEEVEMEDYECEIEGDESGFVIINRWIEPPTLPEEPEDPRAPEIPENAVNGEVVIEEMEANVGNLPRTGDRMPLVTTLGGLGLLVLGLFLRRK